MRKIGSMPLRKFCKIVGVLILAVGWFPVVWAVAGMVVMAEGAERAQKQAEADFVKQLRQFEDSMPFKAPQSPYSDADISRMLNPEIEVPGSGLLGFFLLAYLLVVPGFAVWLFFPGNPLERLVLWLAEDRDSVSLTTILVREAPSEPPQKLEAREDPTPPVQEAYRHPDEDYMPPAYRPRRE
jgi:hypothetical protein